MYLNLEPIFRMLWTSVIATLSDSVCFAILRRMPKKSRASHSTTVGLVQMSCEQKPETNLKKAIAGINEAAKRGAQIVCLQELFRSQYFCQTEDIELFKLAETIPGPSTEALGKVASAKESRDYCLTL